MAKSGNSWNLVGDVDVGQTCNALRIIENGKKETQLAAHVLQYLYVGYNGFQWPVSYYDTTGAKGHELYSTTIDTLYELDVNDFCADVVMLDGASINRSLAFILCNGKVPRGKPI